MNPPIQPFGQGVPEGTSFTEEQVKYEARRRYGRPICIDHIDEAMHESSLDRAVNHILLDTIMWDSPTGNPLDPELWAKVID